MKKLRVLVENDGKVTCDKKVEFLAVAGFTPTGGMVQIFNTEAEGSKAELFASLIHMGAQLQVLSRIAMKNAQALTSKPLDRDFLEGKFAEGVYHIEHLMGLDKKEAAE